MRTNKLTTTKEILDTFMAIYENIEELEYQMDKSNRFQCLMYDNEAINPEKYDPEYCFENMQLVNSLLIDRRSAENVLISKILEQGSALIARLKD